MTDFDDYPDVLTTLHESVGRAVDLVKSHRETDQQLLNNSTKDLSKAEHSLFTEGQEPNRTARSVLNKARLASAESGADRLEGFEDESWEYHWAKAYFEFLKLDALTPQSVASRVLQTFHENTESFEVGGWASHLAYLVMAIVDPIQEPKMKYAWNLADAEDHPTRLFRELMNSLFATDDPVWDYIEVEGSTKNTDA